MNLNKREKFSFTLGLIINIIIILIIPGYKIEDVKDRKLKVGLVALEKEKVYKKETKKKAPSKKENVKKEVVQKVEQNENTKKIEVEKKKSLSLDSLSKTIKAPSIDVIKTNASKKNKSSDLIADVELGTKKQLRFEREDKLGLKIEKLDTVDSLKMDKSRNSSEADNIIIDNGEDLSIESIKVEEGKIEGLPSGYKLGVEDGDIIARWDSTNKEPEYPESAQLRGLQGSVRVKIDVNEKGEVTNLIIEKGSGVPEINSAIESIGRTWKIYLSKHGLSIKGRVILDYTFKLKGN